MDKAAYASDILVTDDQIRAGCDFNAKFLPEKKNSVEIDFFVYYDRTNKKLTKKAVADWKKHEYATYKDFSTNHANICIVNFSPDATDWKRASRTCLHFDTNYICEHIISISYQLGIIQKPDENYDDEPLFQPKKGRPAKATNPLQKEK